MVNRLPYPCGGRVRWPLRLSAAWPAGPGSAAQDQGGQGGQDDGQRGARAVQRDEAATERRRRVRAVLGFAGAATGGADVEREPGQSRAGRGGREAETDP